MSSSRRSIAVVGATIGSGVLSGYFLLPNFELSESQSAEPLGLLYGPGFFFGLAMAVLLWRIDKLSAGRSAAWLAASIVSWRIAFEMSTNSFSVGDNTSTGLSEAVMIFVLPGAIGAALLAVSHQFIALRVDARWVGKMVIAGAVLGFAMYLITLPGDGAGTPRLIVMFTVWQVGVGLVLDAWSRETLSRSGAIHEAS